MADTPTARFDRNKIYQDVLSTIHNTPDIRDMAPGGDTAIANAVADRVLAQGGLGGDNYANTLVSQHRGGLSDANAGNLISRIYGITEGNLNSNLYAPDAPVAPPTPEAPIDSGGMDPTMQKMIDNLFSTALNSGNARITSGFTTAKNTLGENDAATGRYRSPIAKGNINDLAGQEELAKTDLAGTLATSKIGGTLDYSKFMDTLLAGERRAKEAQGNFNTTLGYQKESDAQNRALAEQLGQLQAKSKEPNWLDYFKAFSGPASTIGSAAIMAG